MNVLKAALRSRETTLAVALLLTLSLVQSINHAFLGTNNVRDLLVQISPFVILSCGMTFVMLLGEIDISVGSVCGLLSACLGLMVSPTHLGLPANLVAVVVIAAGAMFGLVNGLLVAFGRVPSIIVTLGMLTVLRGVTEVLLGGKWVTDLTPAIRVFGTGQIVGIPVPVLAAGLTVALSVIVATQTPFGRRLYAVGSNPHAAEIKGLPSRRIKLVAFAVLGMLAGLATLVSAPQLLVVESGFASGWELFVVTCVVVGGVSAKGGRGTVVGAVLGVALLGIVRTVLIFAKLGDQAVYWERSIQGAFILGAVLADRMSTRTRQGAAEA